MNNIRTFILWCLIVACTPLSAWAIDACAGKPAKDTGNNLPYCTCLIYPNGTSNDPTPAIALPLIKCLTEYDKNTMVDDGTGTLYPRGIIPYATYHMLKDSAFATYFKPIVSGVLTLALALYGFGLYSGSVKDAKSETFILVLKIAGIYYFINSSPDLYLSLIDVVKQLCDAIASGATSLRDPATDHFWGNCAVDATGTLVAPGNSDQIWSMWDCTLNYLLGFSGDSVKWIGVVFVAMLFLATLGTGMTIAGLIIGMIIGLLLLFARFMQTYVMAILALSFMFFIGFLFVPLLVFKHQSITEKLTMWFNFCFGFILTPVIMMGYMCMMLVALDIVLFTGDNSLFERLQYGSKNQAYDPNGTKSPVLTLSNNTQNSFMSYAQVDYNNRAGDSVKPGEACDPAKASVGSSGPIGVANIPPATGSASEKNMAASTAPMGLQLRGLNIVNCDATSDKTHQNPPGCTLGGAPGSGLADRYGPGGIPSWQYISGVLNSSAAAVILIYVMHAVLGYLPSLVEGLVGGGSGAGLIAQTLTGTGQLSSQKLMDSGYGAMGNAGGKMRDMMAKMVGKSP